MSCCRSRSDRSIRARSLTWCCCHRSRKSPYHPYGWPSYLRVYSRSCCLSRRCWNRSRCCCQTWCCRSRSDRSIRVQSRMWCPCPSSNRPVPMTRDELRWRLRSRQCPKCQSQVPIELSVRSAHLLIQLHSQRTSVTMLGSSLLAVSLKCSPPWTVGCVSVTCKDGRSWSDTDRCPLGEALCDGGSLAVLRSSRLRWKCRPHLHWFPWSSRSCHVHLSDHQ